jgi:flagellar motor switch protein FliN/FliY
MDDAVASEQATNDAPQSLDDALGTSGELINEIEQSIGSDESGQPVQPMSLGALTGQTTDDPTMRDLEVLADVQVEVAVEFGRTKMPLRQLLMLLRGSLVELSRRPEQQVTVLANGTPVARGDIVVVDDQVGVHIVELIDPTAPGPPLEVPAQVDVIEPATSPEPQGGDDDTPAESEGDA